MGFVVRTSSDRVNPTLPGGNYGPYITAGRGAYYRYSAGESRMYFVLFISDGGRYGLDSISDFSYNGAPVGDYNFHRGKYTKQIDPKIISSVNTGTDVITSTAHPFNN